MTLDVIRGESRNRQRAGRLADALERTDAEGTIYLGYPVLSSADDRVEIDALLVSKNHGLIAFQIVDDLPQSESEWKKIQASQDRLYNALDSHLGRHESLRRRRQLAVPINTISVFPSLVPADKNSDTEFYVGIDEVPTTVESLPPLDESVLRALESALQRVTTIKPAKRRADVERTDSKGAVLKEIERQIANLDRWQKQAAIESPDGPQRIRGLAGSGKTVVLALKAAYLHTQHPSWRIAVTFQTRALYQQFQDLITRFTFEHSNDSPDLSRLQIVHAWGSASRIGVYNTIARHLNAPVRDWNYARAMFGQEDAFAGVCRELLGVAQSSQADPIWDAVLIDEAQDLPVEFFRLIYRFTKEPKRIVWGYDELQKLSESAMPSTEELFGANSDGESLVSLHSAPGEARRDIILPICYRNTPWALATAHATGFGIYRPEGLVQYFDESKIWEEIGYEVVSGQLRPGRRISLKRSGSSYPTYFESLLKPSDALVTGMFNSEEQQDEWVSQQIRRNLNEDELEYDDILIVLPSAYTAKKRAVRFSARLARYGIASHHVGVQTSVDEVFVPGSVAIAHIFRAKGNEAPMVYALDSQFAAQRLNAVTKRNTLFTAITRSRAWVRIVGFGVEMADLMSELQQVQDRDFKLEFKIPTRPELQKLRRLHRDRSDEEAALIERTTAGLSEFLAALDRDELDLADLPVELRTRLVNEIRRQTENEIADVEEGF